MTIYQPPPGISAPTVTNIPKEWSATWFRRFITQHLEGADVRNAIPGPGITITTSAAVPKRSALTARPIISAGGSGGIPLSSIQPMAPFTVAANDTGASAPPTAINQTQLTSMLNAFTASLAGAVPASGGGGLNFLRADGTWAIAMQFMPTLSIVSLRV